MSVSNTYEDRTRISQETEICEQIIASFKHQLTFIRDDSHAAVLLELIEAEEDRLDKLNTLYAAHFMPMDPRVCASIMRA